MTFINSVSMVCIKFSNRPSFRRDLDSRRNFIWISSALSSFIYHPMAYADCGRERV